MRVAFDVIGDKKKAVAILGVNVKNQRKAAKQILKNHKNVKSVLKKLAERKDIYRLYPCKVIAGSKNTEVIHKEHEYLIKVDPQKAYFSPREATERQRIAKKVKSKERILVMFSGVAPYAIAIAKKHPKTRIVCVDINLNAIRYANQNVKLNKLKNIKNICWDVREMRRLGKFDRIIMPLVETAYEFLDIAFAYSKKGTIIHLYGLSGKDFKDLEKKVKNKAKLYNFRIRILRKKRILPYAPRIYKVRIDIKILS